MRVAALSLSPLDKDSRVQRSAGALIEAGHDVLVVAREPLPQRPPFRVHALRSMARPVLQRLEMMATQAPASLLGPAAHPLYWLPRIRHETLRAALAHKPDVVLCNDWITLPIGAAVKRRTGAALVYDSHEFATREHVQNWKWRLIAHAAVCAIEARHIRDADRVLTVSASIAEALADQYRLPEKPLLVRNLPSYQAMPFRRAGSPVTVLFHGLIRAERGLEELIDSMPLWRDRGRLTIRGYGPPAYLEHLRRRAHAAQVGDRVQFEPPLPPAELIARAAEADIGYLALPGTTEQYEFALPNKLFEYLMVGLAVLASPRREIATVLSETGAGVTAPLEPRALAAAVNGLTGEGLDRMRRAALEAAKTLNWEAEKRILVDAVGSLRRAG